jgi:hypothetical protein
MMAVRLAYRVELTHPAHSLGRRVGMVAELLRHLSKAAAANCAVVMSHTIPVRVCYLHDRAPGSPAAPVDALAGALGLRCWPRRCACAPQKGRSGAVRRRPGPGHDCQRAGCCPHVCHPIKASTIRGIHSILSGAFAAAQRCEWTERNPAASAKPPTTTRKSIAATSPEDVAKVIAQARAHRPPWACTCGWSPSPACATACSAGTGDLLEHDAGEPLDLGRQWQLAVRRRKPGSFGIPRAVSPSLAKRP